MNIPKYTQTILDIDMTVELSQSVLETKGRRSVIYLDMRIEKKTLDKQ